MKKFNVKKSAGRLALILAFLSLFSYKTSSTTYFFDKSLLNGLKQYRNSNPIYISNILNQIFKRENLYAKIIKEYAKKFQDAGFGYSEKQLSDLNISLEYIESRGDLEAISKAGAEGVKQLMPDTAKDYGLKNNHYLNESFNPEKATIASLEYILRYAKAYGSIDLALLAYNAGPGAVEKILKQCPNVKHKHEFPKELLNEESKNYVDKFYFILKRIKEPEKYGISINSAKLKFREYKTKKGDNLIKIAKKYHSSEDLIAQYNGIKDKSRIPVNYSLLIPQKR